MVWFMIWDVYPTFTLKFTLKAYLGAIKSTVYGALNSYLMHSVWNLQLPFHIEIKRSMLRNLNDFVVAHVFDLRLDERGTHPTWISGSM